MGLGLVIVILVYVLVLVYLIILNLCGFKLPHPQGSWSEDGMKHQIKIKIQADGQLIIERGSNKANEEMFNIFADQIKNVDELSNFLFQWPDRQVLIGRTDLCG